jgi:hypothetical protein
MAALAAWGGKPSGTSSMSLIVPLKLQASPLTNEGTVWPFPVLVGSVNAPMPVPTDRQRIELAVPAYLLYALTGAPDVFVPANPDLTAKAEADIAELRGNLRTACLEPFADLPPSKRQALMRRLERLKQLVIVDRP